ncbi:MAG: hypothetical protein JXK07_01745 [Spirochaetes bacterium]|nr:hypothetical protein [Spirochaetota bacterium]MBN2772297.1 hypothetical protein [Spirochaetota bacterium]
MDNNNFGIDTNRIFLTGWSQRGTGGYNMMREFFNKEMCFAAMIRVAGMSQTTLPRQIVTKASILYHIGLSDSSLIRKTSKFFLQLSMPIHGSAR